MYNIFKVVWDIEPNIYDLNMEIDFLTTHALSKYKNERNFDSLSYKFKALSAVSGSSKIGARHLRLRDS